MKKFIYFIEFILIQLLFLLFSILGYKNSSNLGYFIGKFIGPFFRSKSSIKRNLNQAEIKKENNYDLDLIASNVLGNYGRIFSEYVFMKDFRNEKLQKYITINGTNILNDIIKEQKRVVFVSGHFNNFELMAMQLDKYGINLTALYRPLNNMFLNKTMEKIRTKFICQKQIKKGRSGMRELVKNFQVGSSIALMIDQRVREGINVPFFKKPCSTTSIPAQIVKKYDCEIVPIYIERKKGYHFEMTILQPMIFDKNSSIEMITTRLNETLEQMILKNVDQWIWTHNRWQK